MAAKAVPKSNLEAARSDDQRAALVVLRDSLAAQLDDARSTGVYAQLAAQYRATLADLAALKAPAGKGGVDELKDRRAAKGRGSAPHASSNA